jgi:hypothetical protein
MQLNRRGSHPTNESTLERRQNAGTYHKGPPKEDNALVYSGVAELVME